MSTTPGVLHSGRQNHRAGRFPAAPLDQAMYQAAAVHDRQCRCVIRLAGQLDAARLARAVELSLLAEPVLACRYVPGTWRAHWEPCDGKRATPFDSIAASNPVDAIDAFLAAPLQPLLAPPLAVRLIRAADQALCIKLDHLVSDAGGLLYYARLLRDLYRKLAGQPDYQPAPLPGAGRALRPALRAAGWRAMIRGLATFRLPQAGWHFPAQSTDRSGRAFIVRVLPAERVARLKAWCQPRKARFSDVLLTAYHRALCTTFLPRPGALLPVEVTVDLRRFLPPGAPTSVADLSGASFPAIRYLPGASFEDTLAAAQATAVHGHNEWVGSAVTLEILAFLPTFLQTLLAERVLPRFSGTGNAVLSNIGALPPDAFDFGDASPLAVDLFGPVHFPPNLLVTTYGFANRLVLTSSYCSTAVDADLLAALLDRIIAELPG